MEPGIKTEVIGEKKQRSEAIKFAIKFAAIGVENRLVCRRLKTRSRVNHSAQIFLDIAITCHARKNTLSKKAKKKLRSAKLGTRKFNKVANL